MSGIETQEIKGKQIGEHAKILLEFGMLSEDELILQEKKLKDRRADLDTEITEVVDRLKAISEIKIERNVNGR